MFLVSCGNFRKGCFAAQITIVELLGSVKKIDILGPVDMTQWTT